MKTTNLLIIGGAFVLGGIYLYQKNKNTQALLDASASANTQTQPTAPTNITSTISTEPLLTDTEATVYATNVIAGVNSLLIKYPLLSKKDFVTNYNVVNNTNFTIDNNGDFISNTSSAIVTDGTSVTINPFTTNAVVLGSDLVNNTRINQLNVAVEQFQRQLINNAYNKKQSSYDNWKMHFSIIYSDLKNYFSTLTKERADIEVKYLSRVIFMIILGYEDSRITTNNLFTQQEQMDMVDNKIDTSEDIISKIFVNFSEFLKSVIENQNTDINIAHALAQNNENVINVQSIKTP